MQILWVGLGGFAGAVSRHLLGGFAQWLGRMAGFPVGTLTVNVIGCLLFGLLGAFASSRDMFSMQARAFLFVGFLGSFTTFSTFSNDAVNLFQNGQDTDALIYLGLHLALGLGFVWLGGRLGSWLWA